MDLIHGIRENSRFSISKAISIIENGSNESKQLISEIYKFTGSAHRIGITGPPGAGKSSVTNNLITRLRSNDKKVAVIAVDPTSPFTGGAVLGDRIRMTSHYNDRGVFIRSMASRAGQGGLAFNTVEAADIFDAAGYDYIIYETVGVGQIELDIVSAADTVVVILVPESGDEIQMIKAGLMEIGNIFAINKADRPGSNKLMISLENIIKTAGHKENTWRPIALETVATENKGIFELMDHIQSHILFNIEKGVDKIKIKNRYKKSVSKLVSDYYLDKFWTDSKIIKLDSELNKKQSDRMSPYELVCSLLKNE